MVNDTITISVEELECLHKVFSCEEAALEVQM